MAETTTAPAPEQTAKTDDIQGTTILTTKEQELPAPEKTLFKQQPTIEEAKAAAIKELADKQAADAAKKTETTTTTTATETKVPTEKVQAPADKAATTTQTDYTLDLPENSALTKEDLALTLKEAKEAGLSADEAKEMLQSKDQVAKASQTRLIQKQEQDLKNMVMGWKESVKKDPEMGGDHLAETAIKASRAFKAVASPEMQLFCEKTGYADHPEMVRMMLKVYDLIGEDKFIRGSNGMPSSTPKTMEEKAKKLFGNPIKEAAV